MILAHARSNIILTGKLKTFGGDPSRSRQVRSNGTTPRRDSRSDSLAVCRRAIRFGPRDKSISAAAAYTPA